MFGGGEGGLPIFGFVKAALLSDKRRKRPLPRSCWGSGIDGCAAGCVNLSATETLARRVCPVTGGSFCSKSSSSRQTGLEPKLRLNGKVDDLLVGDCWARK